MFVNSGGTQQKIKQSNKQSLKLSLNWRKALRLKPGVLVNVCESRR